MSVFTIFCHGTNSHRTRQDGEIIAQFGKAAKGAEYQDFLILDGPGSTIDRAGVDKGIPATPMPGTFNPFTRNRRLKSDLETFTVPASAPRRFAPRRGRRREGSGWVKDVTFKGNPEMGYTPSANRPTGLAKGKGWDDNVMHAVAALAERSLIGQQWTEADRTRDTTAPVEAAADRDTAITDIDTVNLMGWSRGAVTCLKIANRLAEFFPQIRCNIFAIDPVAGSGNEEEADTLTIPPNVKAYVATLAMHEQRGGFEAQDLERIVVKDRKASEVLLLPFPGKHNTQVRKTNQPREVAEIVWHLAYRFMTHQGSQFVEGADLTSRYSFVDLLKLYEKVMEDMARYRDLRQRGWNLKAAAMGGIKSRRFLEHLDDYGSNQRFLNVHHQWCMLKANPSLYDLSTKKNPTKRQKFSNVQWTRLGLALTTP